MRFGNKAMPKTRREKGKYLHIKSNFSTNKNRRRKDLTLPFAAKMVKSLCTDS